jgi:uncharacterized membrane protein
MNEVPFRPPDLAPQAYRRMALVLRSGVALAAVLLGGGLVDLVLRHPQGTLFGFLNANPIEGYLTASGLVQGIAAGHSQAVLTLGILVLVATPFARVATGWYYFQRAGDRPMARIGLVVLALLLFGLLVLGPLLH